MLDDEHQFVVARRRGARTGQRLLRVEQRVEAKIAGVRQAIAQVGDDARLELMRHGDVRVG
jgi:hypothetical protein